MADKSGALQQVVDAGVPMSYINSLRSYGKSGPLNGVNLDPQDVNRTIASYQGSPEQGMNQTRGQLQDLLSAEYQFDPMRFLPGIQQQADAIYNPQQAQLEALRLLQREQYKDASITTNKQFEERMQQEVESTNRRGAYFSGGAIEREGDIRDDATRAQTQLSLQAQAADFTNIAQQGALRAEMTQFIEDRLYNAEASAYSRWFNERSFTFSALQSQYQMYVDERNFARSVFESDRSFALDVKRFEFEQEKFKKTYKLSKAQFDFSKDKWYSSKSSGKSEAETFESFISTSANANYDSNIEDWRGSFEQVQPNYTPAFSDPELKDTRFDFGFGN